MQTIRKGLVRSRLVLVGLVLASFVALGAHMQAKNFMWCSTSLGECNGCYAEMECDMCNVVGGGCELEGWGCTSAYCDCSSSPTHWCELNYNE